MILNGLYIDDVNVDDESTSCDTECYGDVEWLIKGIACMFYCFE